MTRTNVSAQATAGALFTEKEVQRFQCDTAKARTHLVGRNRRVAQVLCHLSLMRAAGLIKKGAAVRCERARKQHFNSDSDENKEAAHYLPGQILVSSRLCWLLLPHGKVRTELEELFADVQDLAADYNKADTFAEQHAKPAGLKALFAKACRAIVGHDKPAEKGKVNRQVLDTAYQTWLDESKVAYQFAAKNRRQRGDVDSVPDGTRPALLKDGTLEPHLAQIDERRAALERSVRKNKKGKTTSTTENYAMQASILETYAATVVECGLSPMLVGDVEGLYPSDKPAADPVDQN